MRLNVIVSGVDRARDVETRAEGLETEDLEFRVLKSRFKLENRGLTVDS